MADDPWAELRQQVPEVPGKDSYSRPVAAAPDPWAELRQSPKQDSEKERNDKISKALGKYNKYIPGADLMQNIVNPSLAKGIPVARHYIPQTSELDKFEEEHPWASKGLQTVGAVGSTAPLAGAAAIRSGAGFIPQWAGQTAVAAPLNVADSAARTNGNLTGKDVSKDLITAGITSTIPAAATSVLGQSARTIPRTLTPEMNAAKQNASNWGFSLQPQAQFPTGRNLPHNLQMKPGAPMPSGQAIPGTGMHGMGESLTSILAGGAGLYAHGPLGAAVGLMAGKPLHTIMSALGNTKVGQGVDKLGHNPSVQDILRVMSQKTGMQMAPNMAIPEGN